jgi:hypothetical protein
MDNSNETKFLWYRTVFLDACLVAVVFCMIVMGKSIVVEQKHHDDHLHMKNYLEQASLFLEANPQVMSIEVWELTGDSWFCKVSAGVYNLCSLTPSYPDDKWSKATSVKIAKQGHAYKSLDGNPEFTKYTDLIGYGYYFYKMDISSGKRIVFITKDPLATESMTQFLKDNEELLNDLH